MQKQDDSGIWIADDGFNGRYAANLDTNTQNKWVTLKSLLAIKYFYS
jgi:hypothetical protein